MTKTDLYNMTHTEQKMLDCRDNIEDAEQKIAQCNELLEALDQHTGKLIDKRFFEKHFTETGEYRNWTRYNLSGKRYDWDKYTHRICLQHMNWTFDADEAGCSTVRKYSDYEYIELDNRKTAHVIEQTKNFIGRMHDRIAYNAERIAKYETLDERQLVKDLRAVYFKHGEPDIWGAMLDLYEVKYPNN